jgi:hypothetical protein
MTRECPVAAAGVVDPDTREAGVDRSVVMTAAGGGQPVSRAGYPVHEAVLGQPAATTDGLPSDHARVS